MTRKEFLQEVFSFFRKSEGRIIQQKDSGSMPGIMLPPGAPSVENFLKNCTQCYQCVADCPHEVIRVYRQEDSRFYGFPVIEPRLQPCHLCEELPCVKACKDGAIQKDHFTGSIGKAVLFKDRCLVSEGYLCMSCINACPKIGQAIQRGTDGFPVIFEAECTGCGECEFSCPLEVPAIRIIMNQNSGE